MRILAAVCITLVLCLSGRAYAFGPDDPPGDDDPPAADASDVAQEQEDDPAPDVDVVAITGRQLGPFVLPVEPITTDVSFRAQRAVRWTADDTQRLILEGDVRVRFGGYWLSAETAVIWINRLPSAEGLITQIALYFPDVRDPARRAGFGVAGQNVLMTGSTLGEVRLEVTDMRRGRPHTHRANLAGEQRLQEYLRQLAGPPDLYPPLRTRPHLQAPQRQPDVLPVPGGLARDLPLELPDPPDVVPVPPLADQPRPLFVPDGIFRFHAGRIETMVHPDEDEGVIIATGSVVFEYLGRQIDDEWTQLTLTAERAVVFTDPDFLDRVAQGQFRIETVHSIYLEGNVIVSAEHDRYQIRAPQIYYDLQSDQAVMVDAVLRTYSRQLGAPIYWRAREMRQISQTQWEARRAFVSTSEFATPHIAVGSQRVTIRQIDLEDDEPPGTEFLGRHNTLRIGGMPVLYWPRYRGRITDTPLDSIRFSQRRHEGFGIITRWNVFGLTDTPRPPGIHALLRVDGYVERGAGGGLELRYARGEHRGNLEVYGLYDTGDTDRTSAGRNVSREEDLRGVVLWEHMTDLGPDWMLQLQGSFISDETFVSAWRPSDFRTRREYETSAYLLWQRDNAALSLLARYDLNDFISNDYLLASRQTTVEKTPEIAYRRIGDSLFGDTVTYTGSISGTYMRFQFEPHTPRELGVRQQGFGIGANRPFSDVLADRGMTEQYVARADTRHEISIPMQWSIWQITPFITGRITAYDREFLEFSSDADDLRYFVGGGVRLATQFHRIFENVQNRTFDLHRLRHVIEPYITLWYGYSNVSNEDLPIYDPTVEGIGTAAAAAFGLRNTWQTKRGGPGRWYDVDFFTIDARFVTNSNDANRRSPYPQFFDYQPEVSMFGEHASVAATWMISDNLTMGGTSLYDFDVSEFVRNSIGFEMRHTPDLWTSIEYRNLRPTDTELISVGWRYQISQKYRVSVYPQWDVRLDRFRWFRFEILRQFPDFELILQVDYDDIRDETSLSLSLGRVFF